MKYQKADILPEELLKEIQKYVQGTTIYIPASKKKKKNWGECSGERGRLDQRNMEIFQMYHSGYSVKQISELYYLSESSIHKILHNIRKQ